MLHTPRLQLSWRRPHAVTVLSHPVPAISNHCLVCDNSPSSEALIAQSEVVMRQLEREDATSSKTQRSHMRRSQSMWLNPDGSPCLCGHTICQIFHFSHNNVCLFVWKQRELKTFWTLIKFSGLFSFQPNRSHPPGRRVTIMLISHKTSFWAHRAIYELDILLIVFRSGLLCFLSMPSPFHSHYLHEVMGTWSVLLSCL